MLNKGQTPHTSTAKRLCPDSAATAARTWSLDIELPHWYAFGANIDFEGSNLLTPSNWDALRAKGQDGFRMPLSAQDWHDQARRDGDLNSRAAAIVELLAIWQCSKLVSVGVGNGLLESLIKATLADLTLRCGDYASAALAVLRDYLAADATVEPMDLRNPSWAESADEAVLLHRVDMELNDAEWMVTFEHLARAGVRHVIVVPCGIISLTAVLLQFRTLLLSSVSRSQLLRNGWVRSPRRIVKLFSSWYCITNVIHEHQFEVWGLTLMSSSSVQE